VGREATGLSLVGTRADKIAITLPGDYSGSSESILPPVETAHRDRHDPILTLAGPSRIGGSCTGQVQ
jgi:hypothetical protein